MDRLPPWYCCEESLLGALLIVAIMNVLVIWGFRTAEAPWRVRVLYQLSVVAFISRGYLLRVSDQPRSWATNLLIIAAILGGLALMWWVVRGSGLFGPRQTPADKVP